MIAYAPQCTAEEVEEAIEAAVKAFPAWRDTPVTKRTQVLFKMKQLLDEHLDELTHLCAQENGKKWDEAMGDSSEGHRSRRVCLRRTADDEGRVADERVKRVRHGSVPRASGRLRRHRAMEFPGDDSAGMDGPDLHRNRQLHGSQSGKLCASICHAHYRVVEGSWSARRRPEHCNHQPKRAEILLRHPDIKGSFVGSTSVGLHIYATAASNGKRVQALTEAKNHALVLQDAVIERAAQGIINSFCGCAGERCMALPVVVVENSVADELVAAVTRMAKEVNLGLAYDKSTGLGPVINKGHKEFVLGCIEKGIKEGAKLVLDGR